MIYDQASYNYIWRMHCVRPHSPGGRPGNRHVNIHEMRERLLQLGYAVSDICQREYDQTEFFLTDDDGYSHCFGVPTGS
jgi:hypothetical protein